VQHHFDIEIAKKYGVNVAIFLNNVVFWVQKNIANNKHFYDGRYWTYNSVDAYTMLFPYWTKSQIETVIKNCISSDLILKGNYNSVKYDRTSWYALTDNAHKLLNIPISEKSEMESREIGNEFLKNRKPIPDVKTNNKKHIYNSDEIILPDWLPRELWDEFKQHRKEIKKQMTNLSEKKAIQKLIVLHEQCKDINEIINQSIMNGWTGLFEVNKKTTNYINKNIKQTDNNNLRCTVKEYGAGHPTFEANKEWELKHGKQTHGSDLTANKLRSNGVRKAQDCLSF